VLFGVLILVFCLSAVSALEHTCTDSDGLNYSSRGNVTGISLEVDGEESVFWDYCGASADEEGRLIEYVCNSENNVEKVLYDCPYGCVKSVCIEPMVTETVTCVFEDSNEKEKCQNYFYYGYLRPLFAYGDLEYTKKYVCNGVENCKLEMEIIKREDVLSVNYSEDCKDDYCSFYVTFNVSKGMTNSKPRLMCEGKNNCSIEVTAEKGTKLWWNSLCGEKNPELISSVSGGYSIEDSIEMKETTIVDGVDEIINFDCKKSLLDDFIIPIYKKIVAVVGNFGSDSKKTGSLYYLCRDGTEEFLTGIELESRNLSSYNKLCENNCDRFGENCGFVLGNFG
ncbi:MAG: hypothetical protein OQK82_03760, partial [Candidatus Pacearchaeota archaeon]|nr:hypothetical protein [Candidatus Pacearchaeota archaeon]